MEEKCKHEFDEGLVDAYLYCKKCMRTWYGYDQHVKKNDLMSLAHGAPKEVPWWFDKAGEPLESWPDCTCGDHSASKQDHDESCAQILWDVKRAKIEEQREIRWPVYWAKEVLERIVKDCKAS